jgi:hypothetical protein
MTHVYLFSRSRRTIPPPQGRTPLHYAADAGLEESVMELLKADANKEAATVSVCVGGRIRKDITP